MQISKKEYCIVEDVEQKVCSIVGVDVKKVLNKDKSMKISMARSMIWYILHFDYGMPVNKISHIYIRKNRNVWSQLSKVKHQIEIYSFWRILYDEYKEEESVE